MKEKSTDELINIINADREKYPEEEIVRAAEELKARTSDKTNIFRCKIKKHSRTVAVVGGLMFAFGILGTIIKLTTPPSTSSPENTLFLFRNFDFVFICVTIFEAISGVLFLTGGLLLGKYKELGRRLIIISLSLVILYLLLFTAVWQTSLLKVPGSILMSIVGIIISLFFAWLLWIPLRYFMSPRVKMLLKQKA